MGANDSTIVVRTGYMVPVEANKPKLLPKTKTNKIIEELLKEAKTNETKKTAPYEREEYRRIPDGSLQKVRVKFTPATEQDKKDLWEKWMNKVK